MLQLCGVCGAGPKSDSAPKIAYEVPDPIAGMTEAEKKYYEEVGRH